jgi:hypothetical protein
MPKLCMLIEPGLFRKHRFYRTGNESTGLGFGKGRRDIGAGRIRLGFPGQYPGSAHRPTGKGGVVDHRGGGRAKRLQSCGAEPGFAIAALPDGCSFAPRCSRAMGGQCEHQPPVVEVSPGREVECWLETAGTRG